MRFMLFVRQTRKPYLTALPSPSASTSPGRRTDVQRSSRTYARCSARARQQGPDPFDRSLRRTPAPRSCSAPRTEPAESSAPWTRAPLHRLLQEHSGAAAGRSSRKGSPGWHGAARGPPCGPLETSRAGCQHSGAVRQGRGGKEEEEDLTKQIPQVSQTPCSLQQAEMHKELQQPWATCVLVLVVLLTVN